MKYRPAAAAWPWHPAGFVVGPAAELVVGHSVGPVAAAVVVAAVAVVEAVEPVEQQPGRPGAAAGAVCLAADPCADAGGGAGDSFGRTPCCTCRRRATECDSFRPSGGAGAARGRAFARSRDRSLDRREALASDRTPRGARSALPRVCDSHRELSGDRSSEIYFVI